MMIGLHSGCLIPMTVHLYYILSQQKDTKAHIRCQIELIRENFRRMDRYIWQHLNTLPSDAGSIINFRIEPHEVFEFSRTKLKNLLKIGLETIVLVAGSSQ